jgi:pyruvate dehydrogenase E1 component alpha subunit
MLTKKLTKSFSTFKILLEKPSFHLMPEEFPESVTTTKEELLKYYRELQIMRRMEMAADKMYKDKKIFGFCHLYDGQEASALGMAEALNFEDPLIGAYRIHCTAYTRGISVFEILTEMLGKQGGSSKGKGGSMHFYRKKNNFYGGNGIVGDQVPVGVGLAFALKYNKNNTNVAITLYGDGGANQGQVYEAANMASIWNLPMIFYCENNHYAMGTSIQRSSAGGGDFHKKLYNVPGIKFDGQNIFQVREVVKLAKKFALVNGPIALNCLTYRYHGHSMSDPGSTYRNREEVQEIRKNNDPILNLKKLILDFNAATEEELKDIEKETKQYIEQESEKAESMPEFTAEHILQDVFVKEEKTYFRAPNYEDSIFIKEKLIQ